MVKARARAVFSIQGAAAQEKIGKFGFFEGSYTAILQFIQQKGLEAANIVGDISHNGTNYYIFYWKGS
ncbi:hypothetical protein LCGC14_2903390 [marine sediment metagenome]|uniref:Uncharacterized protein n=1 Tax=marine sediment metagenome TaxID=412755 RepID=A0A0F9AJY2_9ZZZZ